MEKINLKKQLKKYPDYKESGIDWIGKIPKEWEIKKIRHLGILIGSTVDKKINENDKMINLVNYKDVYNSNKITSNIDFMKVSATANQLIKNQVEVGDVLFTPSSETIEDIGHSAVIIEKIPNTLFSYHLVKLKFFQDVNNDYKKYLFNNDIVLNQFSSFAMGITRMVLSRDDFCKTNIILASRQDQEKIAKYLDEKTELIEQIIGKKKKLTELLQEKRIATINRAVTKGLDNGADMIDSGVDWIGEIPNNWNMLKLKYAIDINSDTLPETTNPDYQLRYIDIGSVNQNGLISEPDELLFSKAPSRARRIIGNNQTIIGTVRTYLKALAYFEAPEDNLIASTGFAVLRPRNTIFGKYLYYSVMSEKFIQNVSRWSVGVSYPAINPTDLGNLPILIPDFSEQKRIVDFVDIQVDQIENILNKISKSIVLLVEYRSSLISSAVTGKILI